jgi:hypothetical protein
MLVEQLSDVDHKLVFSNVSLLSNLHAGARVLCVAVCVRVRVRLCV